MKTEDAEINAPFNISACNKTHRTRPIYLELGMRTCTYIAEEILSLIVLCSMDLLPVIWRSRT